MASNVASGTSTPGAGPSSQTLDPYRTISSALQRPLAPFIPSSADIPPLPSLLNVKESVISDRLTGKNLLFTDEPISKTPSALVTGRKRNKGDPASKQQARKAAEDLASKRSRLGLISLRKSRRNGGVVRRGDHIAYTSLIPLYHLHTLYLCTLLALPPLPPTLPPASQIPSLPIPGSADGMATKLLKADFTGIHLKVVAARNPSLINLQGIVIEETESTFRMVPIDGRIRVIPKDGTQFLLSFPAYSPRKAPPSPSAASGDLDSRDIDVGEHLAVSPRIQLTLLGTNFCFRSADRAGRKFKLAHGGGGNGWGSEWVQGEWTGILDKSPTKPKSTKPCLPLTQPKKAEKGMGAGGMRKRGKSRRKDLLAGGSRQVVF